MGWPFSVEYAARRTVTQCNQRCGPAATLNSLAGHGVSKWPSSACPELLTDGSHNLRGASGRCSGRSCGGKSELPPCGPGRYTGTMFRMFIGWLQVKD